MRSESNEALFLGASMPTEPSEAFDRGGRWLPCRGLFRVDCMRSMSSALLTEGKEPDASKLRLKPRLAPGFGDRFRFRLGVLGGGSADNLSDNVSLEEDVAKESIVELLVSEGLMFNPSSLGSKGE